MTVHRRARVVAIIQARMGSERLPGKVLKRIAGKPMIGHVLDRAARAEGVDQVVLATTTDPLDDPIAKWVQDYEFQVIRGHPTDVLDRYYQAALAVEAEVIVRITGDCPLLDPGVVERTLDYFRNSDPPWDFAANRLPGYRTYPIGLDTEICSRAALEAAWNQAVEPHQREHVMPYLYEQANFAIGLIGAQRDYGAERWTVDTQEDLEFVRAVFDEFEPQDDFGWREVLTLLETKPELRHINQGVEHRSLEEIDDRFLKTEERGE